MIIYNGVINPRERVDKKGVSELFLEEIVSTYSIFDIWNGMR